MTPQWFTVLQGARKASRQGKKTFTSHDLVRAADIEPSVERKTKRVICRADQIASAWLGKFVRWGYAERAGSDTNGRHWIRLYTLTECGLTRKPPKGKRQWRAR